MSVRKKPNLFLIHQETGQRYPIGDEVVIGRTSGDILFPEDIKLSSQHCRIVKTPKGWAIHDLDSSNGSSVDGIKLNPKKMYAFKPGSLLEVGLQNMRLQEITVSKVVPARRKRRHKKSGGFDFMSFVALTLIVGAIGVLAKIYLPPNFEISSLLRAWPSASPKIKMRIELETPLQLVEKEMRLAFNEYAEVGRDHTEGRVTDKQLSSAIRDRVIPRLVAARAKMEVLRPSNEWSRKKINANKRLLAALTSQVTAIASFTETKDPKYSAQIETFSAQVDQLHAEVKSLEDARSPAAE